MNTTIKYIPVPSLRRSGQKILSVLWVTAHDTGNDKTTAMTNVKYYIQSANEMEASAHTFIDDKEIIECIPQTEKAWHVRRNVTTDNILFGVDANDYSIGVELCFFSDDKARSILAYNNYVSYIRDLCTKYNLNPLKRVVSHKSLDPDRRNDPINAFSRIGKTWEDFLKDLTVSPVNSKDIILKHLEDITKLVKEL